MINPTFKDTVTLYHQYREIDEANRRTVTKWERRVFEKCFYGTQIAEGLTGTTLAVASGYTVRIPVQPEALEISPGDIIIKGAVSDEIEDVAGKRATDLLARYKPDAFTVRAVADNTKIFCSAHYKVVGV
ncbi:MAG: hypothetical protein IKT39_02460 [Clostridia bacterium]|nr:hypothetical protein [Clostridia bacterium]